MDICLSHISKAFQGKPVIKDFSLTIESGSFTTLLGPSGCGKTTLLRMIAGLDVPDEGEIFLGKTCVYSREKGIFVPPEKRGLGFVFQDFALWPHMTVFENVAFGLRTTGRTAHLDEIVNQALAQVELSDFKERYPHELSGGQQQRVSFARALAYGKDCILFDEPLSALDAKLREEMRSEIRDLVTRLHVTAVFVTHDQIEAMSMSDRIAVLPVASSSSMTRLKLSTAIRHRHSPPALSAQQTGWMRIIFSARKRDIWKAGKRMSFMKRMWYPASFRDRIIKSALHGRAKRGLSPPKEPCPREVPCASASHLTISSKYKGNPWKR